MTSLKHEIEQLRSTATNLESYQTLYNKQKEYLSERAKTETNLKVHRGLVNESTLRRDDLKKKIALIKEQMESEDKQAADMSKLAETCQDHAERCGALVAELRARIASFQYVLGLLKGSSAEESGSNVKYANLGKAIEYQESWKAFECDLDKTIESLVAMDAKLKANGAEAAAAEKLPALVKEVRDLYEQVSGPLAREVTRRNNFESTMAELRESQNKIMLWCRQQRSTMETLVDPAQIQEYNNSFQSNISVMETNFLVLMELAEQLLPNEKVERLLIDVIEVWLGLQVFAFEKLNNTLLGQHNSSKMEDDLGKWIEHSAKIKSFLGKAKELLEMPSDAESEALTQPILDLCISLIKDYDSFTVISEHLSNFSLREVTLKEYYEAIRRTIFSKLTLSTQVYNGQFYFERKPEYMDKLAELNDWVDCKSQNSAWKQLLERVDKMKELIEENEALHGNAEERGY